MVFTEAVFRKVAMTEDEGSCVCNSENSRISKNKGTVLVPQCHIDISTQIQHDCVEKYQDEECPNLKMLVCLHHTALLLYFGLLHPALV